MLLVFLIRDIKTYNKKPISKLMSSMNLNNVKFTFREPCGNNLVLMDDKKIAARIAGYNNGVAFVNKTLQPGEIFLLEILDVFDGWNGNVRIGLTQFGTNLERSGVPKQALPDIIYEAPSWVYGAVESSELFIKNNVPNNLRSKNLSIYNDSIETCYGSYPKNLLRRYKTDGDRDGFIGSRVGIFYIPFNERYADLYLILNSVVIGPLAHDIPYNRKLLHVIVDVYGATKQVKIIDLPCSEYLFMFN